MTDWKNRLESLLNKQDADNARMSNEIAQRNLEAESYFSEKVLPLFSEIKSELEKHGRTVEIDSSSLHATLLIFNGGEREFKYTLFVAISPKKIQPVISCEYLDDYGRYEEKEMKVRYDNDEYSISDIGPNEIAGNFLFHYAHQLHLIEKWDSRAIKSYEID